MKIIDNVEFQQVYNYFCSLYPLLKTDRISDLERISAIDSSFCIYSVGRNGITTLLKDFTARQHGLFVDCMGLLSGAEMNTLEHLARSEDKVVALDETESLFGRLGYEKAMDSIQAISRRKRVVLRLHPSAEQYKSDISQRGLQIVELGQIPYPEFKAIVRPQFERISFAFPEELITSAHSAYGALAHSLHYVAYAFEFLVENPGKQPVDEKLRTEIENQLFYKHAKRR